jgi:hypothetical protein
VLLNLENLIYEHAMSSPSDREIHTLLNQNTYQVHTWLPPSPLHPIHILKLAVLPTYIWLENYSDVHIKTPDASVFDLLSHPNYLLDEKNREKMDECSSFSKNRLSTVLCLALSLGDICMIPKVTPQGL